MNESFDNDEFDSVMELIVTILFMAFGIFATALSTKYLTAKANLIEHDDKISITAEEHQANDPYWYTGYQAYMFAWHMDELSYESLTWLEGHAGSLGNEPPTTTARVDSTNKDHITIGILDENGQYRAQFIPWRNRSIVGTGYAEDCNVKKTINTLANGVGIYDFYRGNSLDGVHKYEYHLELTDAYTTKYNLGHNKNTGGKKFSWVLAPYYH